MVLRGRFMDNRPIGFFDSGLGGLTCIPYLLTALPNERIVYFGDTARTPYGSKAPSTITKFASEITDFLIGNRDVKMVAIACNTVSAVAIEDLRSSHPETPILGIIAPASHAVAKICKPENRIGVIGTKATIRSGVYTEMILARNPKLKIYQHACPALVPLIEEGIADNRVMDLTIEYYLDAFLSLNVIDTLVLGCTHYPLIRENITRLYPGLRIVDPSEEMLRSIEDALESNGIAAEEQEPDHKFYASDLSENFVNMIDIIFSGTGYPVSFDTFDLETFLERRGLK